MPTATLHALRVARGPLRRRMVVSLKQGGSVSRGGASAAQGAHRRSATRPWRRRESVQRCARETTTETFSLNLKRLPRLAAIALLSAGALNVASAQAQNTNFTTSTGHQLELPPVATLSCAELDTVLTRITGTNYRPIGQPRPLDPKDNDLFAYEDAASVRWQENCERGAPGVQGYGSFGKQNFRSWGFGQ